MAFLGRLILAILLLEYPPGFHAERDGEHLEGKGSNERQEARSALLNAVRRTAQMMEMGSARFSSASGRAKKVVDHIAPINIATPRLQNEATVSHLRDISPTPHLSSSSMELANRSVEVHTPFSQRKIKYEFNKDLIEKIRRFGQRGTKAEEATTDEERRKHMPDMKETAELWEDIAKAMGEQWKKQGGMNLPKEHTATPPL